MAYRDNTTHIAPQELPLSAIRQEPYRPRFDGIDAVDAVENGRTDYDGDDFTDRLDYSAELEAVIEKGDAATVLHRLMTGLNMSFPGDLVVFRRDDEPAYAPWTTLRMSVLLGICDSIYRQLYREFTDSHGRVQTSGLIPQRDRAFDRAKRLYGCRNPERLQFALESIHRLDEQINYLEEMGNAAAAVYDAAAAKADSRGLLADWLPMEYQKPAERRKLWAQQNAASPMSPVEYELMVRIEGRDAADAEVKRRQEAWASHMGAK
ncbi:hypothetical protein [Azospirillum sp. sgz301742]